MKKCPSCDKTFEDSMRFCQVDGTPLVDDAPPLDPYATMVASPADIAVMDTPAAPIAEPDDVLDLPEPDPMKTMVASADEIREAMAAHDEPAMEIPDAPLPEPPKFSEPQIASPSFGAAPPPSPFGSTEPPSIDAGAPPVPSPFDMPKPEEALPAIEDEPATVMQPQPFNVPESTPSPFQEPTAPSIVPPVAASAEVGQWTPPPVPDSNWQNQEIGSNTPFQPPPAGVEGESKGLAIASLVVGCLSILCCGWFIPGIVAIVLGFIARGKANSDPAHYGGAGFALGGMITGGISLVLGVIVVILYFMGFAASLMR